MTSVPEPAAEKYTMRLSLNVLDHLGLNLYSSIPAVVSEAVANAWDADATTVSISIDPNGTSIVIADNGIGMSEEDFNKRFLFVGFRRRENGGKPLTARERHVMGRKGIGKLSLFAIANTIKVESVKDGMKAGLIMRTDAIREATKDGKEAAYHPDPIPEGEVSIGTGTLITLIDLVRKPTENTRTGLRSRLARRFSIIGKAQDFQVTVDGEKVTVDDRNLYTWVEYLWTIGEDTETYEELCKNAKKKKHLEGVADASQGWRVRGWIGTVDEQKNISEETNVIPVLAWGKLIHEDLLAAVKPAGIYAKYLMGELHADFVDDDGLVDIATSDRQNLKENDPRFDALKGYLKNKVLNEIGNSWRDWRRDDALDKAKENAVVKEWFDSLKGDAQKQAKHLFGKIGHMALADESDRIELYKNAILAFEKLRHSNLLAQVEGLEEKDQLKFIGGAFASLDEIEAAMYGEVAKGRITILRSFVGLVDTDQREKALQTFLFEHIWLLDPSWERGSVNLRIEEQVKKEFAEVTASLTEEERAGRFDIRYRTAAGKHIIIELKRYSVKVTTGQLVKQLGKYRSALRKCLQEKFPKQDQSIEEVAVLGTFPDDLPHEEVMKTLASGINARVITYDELIDGALESYRDYLDKHKEVSRLTELLDRLEASVTEDSTAPVPVAAAKANPKT